MNSNITTYKVIHEFEVEIERIDGNDEDIEYVARCSQLAGCTIHANSRDEAKNKIEQAIDVWIGYANRQLDPLDIEEMLGL
jgi:predicted RNase H-like HicB family nuclease